MKISIEKDKVYWNSLKGKYIDYREALQRSRELWELDKMIKRTVRKQRKNGKQ